MACSGAYATFQEYMNYFCFSCSEVDEEVAITNALELAASDVHAHLAAVNACDCSKDPWATSYLKKLNIIDAAVVYNCKCGKVLTDELKRMWLEWLDRQFAMIRNGKVELCSGHTGAEYPVIGWAEQSLTEENAAIIIANEIQRLL